MNKTEFLEQLERLLCDIPEQEKEEALNFYKSYFEDAGEENESQVIQELGNPGKVAAIIKADLEDNKEEHGEYTETGYQDERFREENVPEKRVRTENQGPYSSYRGYTGEEHRRQRKGVSWPLIIVLGIVGLCATPLLFGIGGGALALLLAIIFGILGIIVGLFFGGIGCVIGGVAGIIHALMHLLSYPATALATAGASLMLIAAGLLSGLLFIWLVFKLFPVLFRWFVDFIQKLMHRGRNGGENA